MSESKLNEVAAIVILYNPKETILSNISTYSSYVRKIYVFDNTETPQKLIDWSQLPKVEFYKNENNKGLAETLNLGVGRALQDGFEWVLTMDQDSNFPPEAISRYFQCFDSFSDKNNIALFGPTYFHAKPADIQPDCKCTDVNFLITSGAIMNLAAFKKIGGFDEALFIDSVDFDYCIRAKHLGFNIIQFTSIVLIHELGNMVCRSSIKTLFLVKKEKELHSPLRCYYMLRNLFYLQEKFKAYNITSIREVKHGVKNRITNYLFYGRDSIVLTKYIILAYKDFKKNRMGKFQH